MWDSIVRWWGDGFNVMIWGTVADWFGAIGTIGAVIVALYLGYGGSLRNSGATWQLTTIIAPCGYPELAGPVIE